MEMFHVKVLSVLADFVGILYWMDWVRPCSQTGAFASRSGLHSQLGFARKLGPLPPDVGFAHSWTFCLWTILRKG